MFSKTQFEFLYAYHWSIRRRLLEHTGKLASEDYFKESGYGRGSIHSLFFHLLNAEQSWRLGLKSGQQLAPLNAEDYPDHAAIQAGIAGEQAAWDRLLDKLSSAEIEADLDLTDRRGRGWSLPALANFAARGTARYAAPCRAGIAADRQRAIARGY